MIRILEEHALNAWPAHQTLLYDGWVLRFAEGYTRRANSVSPLYEGRLVTDEKIAYCEACYTAQGLPTIFKLTPAVQPSTLDAQLAARGYQKDALTSVQVVEDLAGLAAAAPPERAVDVIAGETLTDAWLADFTALNRVDPGRVGAMRRLLENIVPQRCFMALRHEGQTVAVALGVLERGYLGIYDVVTAPEHRQQGFGTLLLHHLLRWSCDQGACRAYLQVMLNNAPARALYARLGFREVYQYWYRVRPAAAD